MKFYNNPYVAAINKAKKIYPNRNILTNGNKCYTFALVHCNLPNLMVSFTCMYGYSNGDYKYYQRPNFPTQWKLIAYGKTMREFFPYRYHLLHHTYLTSINQEIL